MRTVECRVPTSDLDDDEFFRAITAREERIRALGERELSPEEWRAGLAVPMSREEEAEILSLARWFCRRYPTPAERLAYVRRACRRWTRT